MRGLYWITLALLVIGGLNWLLVGLFNYDLVAAIFGDMSAGARAIYTLVGISALIVLATSFRLVNRNDDRMVTHLPS